MSNNPNEMFGVYVHWPFCAAKCPYCDFNSHVHRGPFDEIDYVAAYEREIAHAAELAPGRIVQFSLLEQATPSPETIATLTARLHALVGEDRCGSPVLLDSHRPDAFEMQRFNPRGPQGPADPRTQGPTLRRFRPPVAIRVMLDRGRPVQIPVDRKGMPGGRVVQSAGPWRSSGAWWDDGQAWDRDEWDVEFVDGCVCRVFQVRDTGVWFMEGVLD